MEAPVIAAIIAAIPPTVFGFLSHRKARATNAIVKGNGKGDLAVMQERMLEDFAEYKADHKIDHADLTAWLKRKLGD